MEVIFGVPHLNKQCVISLIRKKNILFYFFYFYFNFSTECEYFYHLSYSPASCVMCVLTFIRLSICLPLCDVSPVQRRVRRWQDGEHQEGHPVPGTRRLLA